MSETELRHQIADVCRRLYEKGFVAASDGNVTARLDEDRLLVTPSGVSKGDVVPESLLVCDMEGAKLSGGGKATAELMLHLAVYRERPDLRAAIHAHPPYATALTVAGLSLDENVLPEVVISLGRIPTTRYAAPGSLEGPEVIRELIRTYDALLLDRHGALACGHTVLQVYLRMEKVEHAAQIITLARLLGNVRTLTPDEISRHVEAAKRHGMTPKNVR